VFFLNYCGVGHWGSAYFFRNGLTIKYRDPFATGTIAVVFIRKHYGDVSDKKVIVDIGANIGTFSLFCASTNPQAIVYAIEPVPDNYRYLVENRAVNGFQDRIRSFQIAVSAMPGHRQMVCARSPLHTFAKVPSADSFEVACCTLKDFIDSNKIATIDLLKMNCEGAEYEILYSTPRTCFEKILEIRMEYHHGESERNNSRSLKKFLVSAGYSIAHYSEYSKKDGFLWAVRK
jgi:FkbM family methyltransferase